MLSYWDFFGRGGCLFVVLGGRASGVAFFFCVSVHLKEKNHPHKHKINSPVVSDLQQKIVCFLENFLLKGPKHDIRSKFYT